jgi:non-homologous end joining protein Ku
VRPHERGIVMYTLHHAAEIRSIDTVDELASVPSTVKPEEMKLAQQVISTFEGPLDLANYKDEYREGLQPGKRSSRRRSRHHPGSST